MSARTLAVALSDYLAARACPELERKQARDEILDQLHSNPQLADDPMFVNAREFLLDEACSESGDLSNFDPRSKLRLDALRTHLRQEVRKFLAVDGFIKPEPAPRHLTKRWTRFPVEELDRARILVAVDGSQQSRWAVRCAERIAQRLTGSLMLIHAIPLPPPGGAGLSASATGEAESSKQIFARARGMLAPDLEVDEIARRGSAADEILRTALDWRADVIVMGTHGRGRVARFLLGSVAEEVIRRAACPVVTVAHEPAQAMWQVDDASTAARDLATACV